MRKNSEARIRANNTYNQKTYKVLTCNMKLEDYPYLQAYLKDSKITVSSYINDLIITDLITKGYIKHE